MNTDSDFIFAAGELTVVNDSTGLQLHVRIGVQGERSLLSRISCYVQVEGDYPCEAAPCELTG